MNTHTANVFLPGCLGPVKREVVLADEAQEALDEVQALSEIFHKRQQIAENKLKAALPTSPLLLERFHKAFRATGYVTNDQASELADIAFVIVRRLCQPEPMHEVEGCSSDGYNIWGTDTDGNLYTVGLVYAFEADAVKWATENGYRLKEKP